MNKIKVAFFAEILIQDFDGASRTMFQLLNRIPSDEFEFMFFCGVPPDKELGCEVVQFPTFRIPYNNTYQVVFPYFSTGRVKKKLAAFQPDVIHIASPSPLGNFARKYAKKQNIPLIAIYHTHFMPYVKYYFKGLPFLIPFFYKKVVQITRTFYKSPDLVYAPTSLVIDELKDICKLDGNNLKLWQRGIDQELFSPQKRDKAFMHQIVQNDWPTILFASRLVWEKNLQTLIDLYRLCGQQEAKVNFVVAGDGVARTDAEKQMPNAFFLGMIDHQELAKVYASSDVYFFPSDTESFGNVVIEAMASGIPCVVANGGGPKSMIVDGENGFLCPTNDVAYYWGKIQLLLHDETLRNDMIQKGLDFVKILSWENLAAIYFNDLKKLAKKTAETV